MGLEMAISARARAASWVGKKLSGKYAVLAMWMFDGYINHQATYDRNVLAEIVNAVKAEDTHDRITLQLKADIAAHFAKHKAEPTDAQLEEICRNFVKNFTMENPNSLDANAQVKAYFHGDLQVIIGSVQELNFVQCHKLAPLEGNFRFSFTYEIVDVYDFYNDRKHMPDFDNYRNNLAFLMQDDIRTPRLFSRSLTKFDLDLATALALGKNTEGLPPVLIVASLMYAAELNGLYQGVPWRAEVESELVVDRPASIRSSGDVKFGTNGGKPVPPVARRPPRPLRMKRLPPARTIGILSDPVYIVKAGDNLTAIAKALLGDAKHWKAIYEANKSTIGHDPNLIRIGQKLTIPIML